nr:MAG TPA: hypothetical protein [Caudoviricetes sp.]
MASTLVSASPITIFGVILIVPLLPATVKLVSSLLRRL